MDEATAEKCRAAALERHEFETRSLWSPVALVEQAGSR
jgi:hypothetical protein